MESDNQISTQSEIIAEPMKELSWSQMPNGSSALQSIQKQKENLMHKSGKTSIEKDLKEKTVLDNSVRFKVDKMVLTEWGVGKITSVTNESRLCKVKIEGDEVEFGFDFINPFITIFFCVLTKTKTDWIALKFNLSDTVETVRRKLAIIYLCHHSQILLIHSGEKLTCNTEKLYEMGFFDGDEMLGVVKDAQEYSHLIFSSGKKMNLALGYNRISFNVNENIALTGMLFYRNDCVDAFYDLTISELNNDSEIVVYQLFNLCIKAVPSEDNNTTLKVDFPCVPIKKGKEYEIKQSFSQALANQYIGTQLSENKDATTNGVKFVFHETSKKYFQKKGSDNYIAHSSLSRLYYVIQTGREF